MVPSGTSVLRVGDFVRSHDPFLSCTAAAPFSEDELMTGDVARDILSNRDASEATPMQGPHEKETFFFFF